MSRILMLSIAFSLISIAGSASADADASKHVKMQSRQIVWQAPPAKKPYALTGPAVETTARTQPADQSGPKVRGRAGFARQ